jgi:hypothetical protein
MDKVKIRNAVIVGLLPAALEGTLIFLVEPKTNSWIMIQAILAWFSFGLVVSLIPKGKRVVFNSIVLTVILNLPWYIAETVVKNTPEHFIPLFIASIVMGGIIGFATKLLDRTFSS